MRRIGRVAAWVVVVLGAVVGALYVALPANTTAEQGPADPILGARRAVIGFLQRVGIVDRPSFFGDGGYLPSAGGSEWGEEGPDGVFVPSVRMGWHREPVYRGLFWHVGDRITYRTEVFDEHRSDRRVLRLCYAENGTRFVAGESTVASGELDASGKAGEVRGYVPRSARGYWAEEVGANGDVHSLHAWGDVAPFWHE